LLQYLPVANSHSSIPSAITLLNRTHDPSLTTTSRAYLSKARPPEAPMTLVGVCGESGFMPDGRPIIDATSINMCNEMKNYKIKREFRNNGVMHTLIIYSINIQ